MSAKKLSEIEVAIGEQQIPLRGMTERKARATVRTATKADSLFGITARKASATERKARAKAKTETNAAWRSKDGELQAPHPLVARLPCSG